MYGRSIDYLKGNSNAKKGEPMKFETEPEMFREIQKRQLHLDTATLSSLLDKRTS